MKILLIGHSVEDHIKINEKEIISPGGVYYTTAGMKFFSDPGDEIFLLTAIDENSRHLFSFVYDEICKDYIEIREKIPRVRLIIFEKSERCEFHENITQRLSLPSQEELAKFHGILLNMITGFDIRLDDLLELRKMYSGLIYMDIHTLSRGLDENNERKFRLIPNVEKWISSVDILQVNEHEIFSISNKKNEFEIAKDSLLLGLKYFILTKGEIGSRIFWLEDYELKSLFFPAIKIEVKNKVGCGDILGAVFFYSLLKFNDFALALKTANIAAGCSTAYSNVTELKKIKDDTFARLN